MPRSKLSSNDGAVLQHIFDPESAPTPELLLDATMPKDPHYENATYAKIADEEKRLITKIELALQSESAVERDLVLNESARQLQNLIRVFPQSAALHNDLAQIVRLKHGSELTARSLIARTDLSEAAVLALDALNAAIKLLSPISPLAAISGNQCRTLAQAYMQRGAMRYAAAKSIPADESGRVADSAPAYGGWSRSALEEAASHDFFMGGRYGNEVGRALAVHTNPTAKLCGQMVQDAMRREFALGSSSGSNDLKVL